MPPAKFRTVPFCAVCGIPFYGFRFAGHLPDRFERETFEGVFHSESEGYDASVQSLPDTAWVLQFEMLTIDPGVPHRRLAKACWSMTGTVTGSLFYRPSVTSRYSGTHNPGAAHPTNIFAYRSYFDTTRHEPAYPVHKECQNILECVLVPRSDSATNGSDSATNGPDLEALYAVFRTLDSNSTDTNENVLLGLQYHEPLMPYLGPRESGPILTPLWDSVPGWECLLANPCQEDHATVCADLMKDFRVSSITVADLSARVTSDPLSLLPWELLDEILRLVDNASLQRLTQASWHVHQVLHDNDRFWQARLRDHMDWFPELRRYLGDPWLGLTQHPKALFLWAMRTTESKQGLRGPYMNIANRRRIWHACGQIADRYEEILLHRPTVMDPVATEISDEAWSPYLPLVAHPVATIVTAPSDTFWLCNWDEAWTEMVLETFWDAEGSLVGMSMAPRGKRRLVGMDDSEHGVQTVTAVIPDVDWVSEIVLHIPRLKYLDKEPPIEDCSYISPTGMTMHFFDRPPLKIGNVGSEQCQRLFRPQEDATIVGVKGQIGVVAGHRRIIRFGIIQAPSPDRDASQPFLKRPLPSTQLYLWAAHPPGLDGCRIWDWPDLDMRAYQSIDRRIDLANVCHDDLVPLEAFIWTMTPVERQSLVMLSAIHVRVHDGTLPPHMRYVTDRIGSLRAEYTAQSGLEPRQIGGNDLKTGRPLPTDDIRKFDIDGPGGEYVTAADVTTRGHGLQLNTNKSHIDRRWWGESRKTNWVYDETDMARGLESGLKHHVGVGMAVVTGIDQLSGQTVITVGALLALPKSTAGEALTWHDNDADDNALWEMMWSYS